MKILLGADPEVFVKDHNDKYISAYQMVDGTKEKPLPVPGGAVQYDGMALEFNIDPAASEVEWENNIKKVMSHLDTVIPKGSVISVEPVANFGAEYMKMQPAEAKILGCDPDYNAYTGDINCAPNPDVDFRTAAAHIHMGYTKDMPVDYPDHFDECCAIIKQADAAIGLPLLLLEPDNIRRELYGKAGAFRPKTYGAEYRVASNFWLLTKELRSFIYQRSNKLIEDFFKGVHYFSDDVEKIINNNDKVAAENYMKKYNLLPNIGVV